MSYAQGDKIDASDYNDIVGSNPSSTTNRINTVWATGSGSAGYGQTALSSVSTGSIVTATQWASLINTLNSIRTHQTGAGSGFTANTAGQKIDFLSNLTTVVAAAYTSRLAFATNSAVVAGDSISTAWAVTVSPPGSNPPAGGSSVTTVSRAFGARTTFASADQARYFFNAGGRLKFNIRGTQSASTTARTNEIISLLDFAGGIATFGANANGGRIGTGATLVTNNTNVGYWTATYAANVVLVNITSTTTNYTSDKIYILANVHGAQGSNNGQGINVDFWANITSTSGGDNGTYSFDDSIGVNVIVKVDISYPETTNLSNTWGAVTTTMI